MKRDSKQYVTFTTEDGCAAITVGRAGGEPFYTAGLRGGTITREQLVELRAVIDAALEETGP